VAEGEPEGEGVTIGVPDGDAVAVGDAEACGLADEVAVEVADAVAEPVGLAVGCGLPMELMDTDGVADGVTAGVTEGVATGSGVAVSTSEAEPSPTGCTARRAMSYSVPVFNPSMTTVESVGVTSVGAQVEPPSVDTS